jgi:hypothetical protein
MISCKLQGGLGNQLFQIYTTISYAISSENKFFFYNVHELKNSITNRYTYWNTFLSSLKPFLRELEPINTANLLVIKEKGFIYSPLPVNREQKMKILNGYFQSPKYFDECLHTINRLLKIDSFKIIMSNRFSELINEDHPISMHFRLGDYKKLPEHFIILGEDYYKPAIRCILDIMQTNKAKILYFCENSDAEEVEKMICLLKIEFQEVTFERADPLLEDWEQLILMSICRYNIIANSTFSWWGAYLNSYRHKKVVYPLKWFGPKQPHNTKDLFPKDWIGI